MLLSASLVGRARELAVCDRVVLGRSHPRSVVVVADTGVGKTRLLREAMTRFEAAGRRTRWVAATRAGATIPFGAVADLLPADLANGTDRLAALQRTGRELLQACGGVAPVVGVDDAHCLDPASAALVHHLVVTGHASVVLTLQSGRRPADPVVALWKDGLARRIDLPPLDRAEASQLVDTSLGGPVDGLTAERLWQVSQGNPRYVCELLRAGVDTGALHIQDGLWQWHGTIWAPASLVELIEIRTRRISRRDAWVLDLLALAEPLDVKLLQAIGVRSSTLTTLEAGGLVVSQQLHGRVMARLSHPIMATVLRTRMSPARARSVYASLASAAQTGDDSGDTTDRIRSAVWHLRAGIAGDPRIAEIAASAALARADYALALQLAEAAGAAGAPSPHTAQAEHVRAASLVSLGRPAEAEPVLAELNAADLTDSDLTRIARWRAMNLHWGLHDPDGADGVLTHTARRLSDPAAHAELVCQQAQFQLIAGSCTTAVSLTGSVLTDHAPTSRPGLLATAVMCQSLVVLGRYDQAAETAAAALTARDPHTGPDSQTRAEIDTGRCLAHLYAGRLSDADTIAAAWYLRTSATGIAATSYGWAWARGEISRARGNLAEAVTWFREADAFAQHRDSAHPYTGFFDRMVFRGLAVAAAQAGDPDTAEAALRRAAHPDTRLPPSPGLDPFASAEAWTAAARGRLSEATTLALAAAHTLQHRGDHGLELIVLHDIVRLGSAAAVVDRAIRLQQVVEGDLPRLMAAHAIAAASADGRAMDTVAEHFDDLGFVLLAGETRCQAARAHQADGDRRRANASQTRARLAAARCPGASTPALASLTLTSPLTAREAEIAALAARGLTSHQIAATLTVAVRTVDNTLGSVYRKLGTHKRADLQSALLPRPNDQ